MGLPDKLKETGKGSALFNFKANFSKLAHLIKTGNITLKLFSVTKIEKHLHIDKSKNLYLNIGELDTGDKENLKTVIHGVKEEGFAILESDAIKKIEHIKTEEKTDYSQKILNFFRGKVPPRDLEIIRGALFVKDKFDKRECNISDLKCEIRDKYGMRGNNIVNLCTAHYFEEYLMPYYEYLIKSGMDEQRASRKLYKLFDLLAEELPFTVFVCHELNKDGVVAQVEAKIQYGAGFINIHGIGSRNVKTIDEALGAIKKTYGEENINIRTNSEKKEMITVRLEIKTEDDLQ